MGAKIKISKSATCKCMKNDPRFLEQGFSLTFSLSTYQREHQKLLEISSHISVDH